MNAVVKQWIFLFCCLAGYLGPTASEAFAADRHVQELLDRYPAQSFETEQALCATLLEHGPEAIDALSRMLDSARDDTRPRTVLQSVAMYVGRPQRQAQRAVFSQAINNSLRTAHDKEIQAFLIELLQWVGDDRSVDVLAGFLDDPRLADPALRALTSIGSSAATQVLVSSLAEGSTADTAGVIIAVGTLRAEQAAEELMRVADSPDPALRRNALWALANMGYATAETMLTDAFTDADGYVSADAGRSYLLLAQRLAEHGQPDHAAAMCRRLLAEAAVSAHLKCGALETLTVAVGPAAMDDLLAAATSEHDAIQAAAVTLANRIDGTDATEQWIGLLDDAAAPLAERIAAMLGQRGDKTALPAVIALFDHTEERVARAAMTAAVQLDANKAAEAIVTMLTRTDQPQRSAAGVDILMRIPGQKPLQTAAQSLSVMPAASRIEVMRGLADRRAATYSPHIVAQADDADAAVRRAAIRALGVCARPDDVQDLLTLMLEAENPGEQAGLQRALVTAAMQHPDSQRRAEPVLQELQRSDDHDRMVLIRTLGHLGGPDALQTVLRYIDSDDADLKDAAIGALADWPDAAAVDGLMQVVQAEQLRYQVIALRSALRLLQDSDVSEGQKVQVAREALDAVGRDQEKQLILAFLSQIKTHEALALAAPYLDEPSLRTAAAVATARIALPSDDSPGLSGVFVADVLTQALDALTDDTLRRQVRDYLDTLAPPEGFTRLFNGKDLTGWRNTDGWAVDDGLLKVAGPGSNLFTDDEYESFELYIEFTISEGGNSGVFFRRAGLEIQLLDDYADKHANLKDWQYSGALYGFAAPSERVSKPAGRWQTMRMRLDGQHLTVILNGTKIIDANLDDYKKEGDSHPGLEPGPGRIGFQNYSGSGIAFRTILLREI